MINIKQFVSLIIVITILLVSCKKDAAPPKPIDINEVVETEPPVLTPIVNKINSVTYGLYSAVPANYHKTTKQYPLLIFIPGAGQLGTTEGELVYLLNDGVGKLLAEKKFPPNFVVNNKNFSFIVLIPQFSQVPTNQEVLSFLEYAKSNYRVDLSRIYFSGLSMGGMVSSDMGAAYSSQIAAIVPISGVFYEGVTPKCELIAKGKLPVWAFHNEDDPEISVQVPLYFVSEINRFSPVIAPKLTVFNVFGHNAWEKAIDPAYKEDNKNVYEWMLHYTR